MTWSPDSSITGGTITAFTTPTYTLAEDGGSDPNSRQHVVTALGGTQAGVVAHSISKPFSVTMVKPKVPKGLPPINNANGVRSGTIPKNTWWLIFRKGADSSSIDTNQQIVARLQIDVPAGVDSYDVANLRGLISFMVGVLNEESNDLADSLITGAI